MKGPLLLWVLNMLQVFKVDVFYKKSLSKIFCYLPFYELLLLPNYLFFSLLAPINATKTSSASAVGSDIELWAGIIPTGSLLNANDKYFWFHHSQGDRMDVLDPDTLDKATALWAAVSYVIADLSDEFPNEYRNNQNGFNDKWSSKYIRKDLSNM